MLCHVSQLTRWLARRNQPPRWRSLPAFTFARSLAAFYFFARSLAALSPLFSFLFCEALDETSRPRPHPDTELSLDVPSLPLEPTHSRRDFAPPPPPPPPPSSRAPAGSPRPFPPRGRLWQSISRGGGGLLFGTQGAEPGRRPRAVLVEPLLPMGGWWLRCSQQPPSLAGSGGRPARAGTWLGPLPASTSRCRPPLPHLLLCLAPPSAPPSPPCCLPCRRHSHRSLASRVTIASVRHLQLQATGQRVTQCHPTTPPQALLAQRGQCCSPPASLLRSTLSLLCPAAPPPFPSTMASPSRFVRRRIHDGLLLQGSAMEVAASPVSIRLPPDPRRSSRDPSPVPRRLGPPRPAPRTTRRAGRPRPSPSSGRTCGLGSPTASAPASSRPCRPRPPPRHQEQQRHGSRCEAPL
ncbi:formin-like protein 20 [Triticum aestivum]|uniref:formin-like protein 20 n=1 Tax=Triticum aestivum TaxID=4565 RepID=UPI001D01B1E8|nr:formin-like protein 20 [Triticum aestivum]XP_044421303.1 formin-like protein 20 [Triticum aestivum]